MPLTPSSLPTRQYLCGAAWRLASSEPQDQPVVCCNELSCLQQMYHSGPLILVQESGVTLPCVHLHHRLIEPLRKNEKLVGKWVLTKKLSSERLNSTNLGSLH
eukprot:TRINITY_DN50537_c0_g1_i1.p1 TRINITY_DN50537_c0_g1~~TRINITY_DN50537_c0_g1_i1.p1  ORF type:complete len:103 (+),score=5.14 TRINITY_DN50537_c0_g1_i1:203-511(+)